MKTKETITDKLKTLAAGAVLMAGVAMGTGCGGGQQINHVPTEDAVDDNDEINDGKPVDNNDTDNTIENNDNDKQPINNDDSDDVIGGDDKDDQPIENEDQDNKDDSDYVINDNDNKDDKDDSDDVINDNDNDPIENNDNDNIPSENEGSDGLWYGEIIATKEQLENLTPSQIENKKSQGHNVAKQDCPYNYIQQPERYDAEGNMYIVDKCEGNLSEPMWLENATQKIIFDRYGVPPPRGYRTISMTVDYSNTGSSSNMKVRVSRLVLDVNFVSASCLSQGDENTSVIEMTPNATYLSEGCKVDEESETLPIETKSTKQTKYLSTEYASLCKSMPNYELDRDNDTCSTTINEFVWLENVVHKLLPKQSNGLWYDYPVGITSIKRDLNTNVFYMDMTIGSNNAMNLHITLTNAKSCIDQCHGKEGCTSHIEPNQNASKGCIINGVEVNGEESAQRLPMKQHNLKHKTAPRFIKPAPAVAKQHYAKNLRPNRQKWLAQNVRNFGRNGR